MLTENVNISAWTKYMCSYAPKPGNHGKLISTDRAILD